MPLLPDHYRAAFTCWCDYRSDRQWKLIARIPLVYAIYLRCSN